MTFEVCKQMLLNTYGNPESDTINLFKICKDKTNQKTLELTKLLSSNKKHNAKFKDFRLRKTCKSC